MRETQKKDSQTKKPKADANSREKKRFIVRKYIYAYSALDAIKQDKKSPIEDCWVDETWENNKSKIGFKDNGENSVKPK
jgi:hypothetical protein